MVTCPACSKTQIVFLEAPRPTSCYYCGARWIQRGDEQEELPGVEREAIVRPGPAVPAPAG